MTLAATAGAPGLTDVVVAANEEGDAATPAAIVASIAASGYAIVRDFIAPRDVAALRARLDERDAAGQLQPAGIGRGAKRVTRADIRGDRIDWLDPNAPHASEIGLWQTLEELRCACNKTLQLGLFDTEAHYAVYPPGSGYARHVDRFRDDDARVLSFILYLNAGWNDDDGGALLLDAGRAQPMEIAPHGGTFIVFLADRFPHEVRPARRLRRSLAGWFRRRA